MSSRKTKATRLARIAIALGLSQSQIAARLGVSESFLSRACNPHETGHNFSRKALASFENLINIIIEERLMITDTCLPPSVNLAQEERAEMAATVVEVLHGALLGCTDQSHRCKAEGVLARLDCPGSLLFVVWVPDPTDSLDVVAHELEDLARRFRAMHSSSSRRPKVFDLPKTF